jgi:NAD kinase
MRSSYTNGKKERNIKMLKKVLVTAAEGVAYAKAQSIAHEVKSEFARFGVVAHLSDEVDVPKFKPEMVIAIGGDGTIMRAMKKYSPYGIPTFGINGGTLGFLAGAEIDNWDESLIPMLEGDVKIEHRLALSVTWRDQEFGPFANEVFVRHVRYPVTYQVAIDGHTFWNKLSARGFMVATATGSNAENFSNFGKPIFPTSADVVLTPMNPQSPAVESFTIPQVSAGGEVSITFLPGKYDGMTTEVWADGDQITINGENLQMGETITIRQHPLKLLLATFGLPQHFRALKKKGYDL